MNDLEWQTFMLRLEASFAGDLPPEREGVLQRSIGRISARHADAVTDLLIADGHRFMPYPAEMVGALRRLCCGPGWDFECALAGETGEQRQARLNAEGSRFIEAQRNARLLAEGGGDE